ncbi:MAG: MFS transporter [Candidatus Dactylopiibacterium carminicum]|nr:MAG: MFS transporter [Candidatus Dactylopiibacterium carminicum]
MRCARWPSGRSAEMEQTARSFRASLAAMIGICLVIILIALDSTVVGTAMPRIVGELRGYDLYPWIASAYLMGSAVTIPIAGRLGDLYGRKPFVLAAIILFTATSAACGFASSMMQLVIARGLQGVGGGMLIGVAFACVPDLFPDRAQRVRWQVMLSASFGIASAFGPSLGGWLTEHFGWRSVFTINLPVAALALPAVWRFLPWIVHHEEGERSIDWLGALLLAAAVVMLLLGSEAIQQHGVTHMQGPLLMLAAIACGAFFVWHQHHSAAPIIPPELFANRDALKLMALGVLTGLSMFVLVFYSPLLLQGGFGASPKEAGFLMTPLLVCVTVGSIINGRLLPRVPRAERVIAWGQVGTLVSCLLLTLLDADSPRWQVLLQFGLCGLSLGFQLPNLTLQMMAVAGKRNFGVGSALVQTTRMLGSMLGVGIAGVLVNARYAWDVERLLADLPVRSEVVDALMSSPQILIRVADQAQLASLASGLGIDSVTLLAQARHALVQGVHNGFILSAVMAAVSLVISLRLPRYEIAKRS